MTVGSIKGQRQIPMTEFFLGYRKTALNPSEVVISICKLVNVKYLIFLGIPFSKPLEYINAYKQSKRRDDDIAIVNAGLRMTLHHKNGEMFISDAAFAFGGMGATTIL